MTEDPQARLNPDFIQCDVQKMTKKSQKQHLDTISRSPRIRVQSCSWSHRIRKFCRIPQILWRQRQLWFPGDRLIVPRCCFWLFFVIFWALSDGYLDENWSSTPLCSFSTVQKTSGKKLILIGCTRDVGGYSFNDTLHHDRTSYLIKRK